MIQSVMLQNFQSHKKTDIVFGEGLNVIVGDSDKGKSAVLRGLLWAIQNKPSGSDYISSWALNEKGNQKSETMVIVRKDGRELHRWRNKKENVYQVEGLKLEAIGKGIPEEVDKFFNFTDVNIQKQMDSPFLLSETAGKVAQTFNRIIKLESIDKALSDVDSKKRQQKSKLKNFKEQSEKLESDIQKYDGLVELDSKVSDYELLETKIDVEDREIGMLESIFLELSKVEDILKLSLPLAKLQINLNFYLTSLREYNSLIDQNESLTALLRDILSNTHKPSDMRFLGRFSGTLNEYNAVTLWINTNNRRLNQLSQVLVEFLAIRELFEQQEEIDHLNKQLKNYSVGIQENSTLENKMNTINGLLVLLRIEDKHLSEYPTDILTLQADLPDSCPLCGGKL